MAKKRHPRWDDSAPENIVVTRGGEVVPASVLRDEFERAERERKRAEEIIRQVDKALADARRILDGETSKG